MIEIRPAAAGDLPQITDIYNDAVTGTTATFDLEPWTVEETERWLGMHGDRYPVLVCSLGGRVVGFASLGEYSPKKAYSSTAVASVYVDRDRRGEGFGSTLLGAVIEAGAEAGFHAIIARITAGNEISIRLFESFDFRHVGRLREVGEKFGRLLDVDIYQRTLENRKGER